MKRLMFFCLILLAVGFISAQQPELLRNSQYLDFEGQSIDFPNGASMVFWNDTGSGSSDILAQKISSQGTVLWTTPRAVVSSTREEKILSAVLTSDNNILVLYRSYSASGDVQEYRVQKFSQAGQPLWGGQGILIAGDNAYYGDYCLVSNALGAAYVIYKGHYPSTDVYGMYLDSFGTNLWPHIPLFSYAGLHEIDAVEDGAGGVIINSRIYVSGGTWQNRVLRFDDSGDMVGSNPLLSPTATVPERFSILKDSQGNYLLYQFQSDGMRLQKMDVNGNLLLPGIVTIASPNPSYTSYYKLKPAPEGGLALLYLVVNYNSESSLSVHYLNSALQELWAQPAVISMPVEMFQMQLDVSDGIWLSWVQQEPGNYDDNTVYSARIETSGSVAFAPLALSNSDNCKRNPILRSLPGKALVIWNDQSADQTGIRAQILSSSGNTLLEPEGRDVYGILNGGAELKQIHKVGTNYLHIYDDTRNNQSSRLYLQLCSTEGIPQLEANGIALNPGSNYPEYYLDSKLTSANTTLLLYTVYQDSQLNLWLQEISASGTTLWPGYGILVSDVETADFDRSRLGQIGDDALVVWRQWVSGSNSMSFWGQRFHTGVPQWQAGGKQLTASTNTYVVAHALQGDYLVYHEEEYSGNTLSVKVLKLGATGDPYAGWPAGGIPLNSGSNYWANYLHSGVVNGDLVVFSTWVDQQMVCRTAVQKVSPSAQLLWGENGLILNENDAWFELKINDAVYAENITWLEQDSNTSLVNLKAVNLAGEFIWGEAGLVLNSTGQQWQDAKLVRFANGTFSVFHTDYVDYNLMNLKRQDISANGNLLSSEAIALVSNRQHLGNLKLSAEQNSGLISWNDLRYYELKRGDAISLGSLWTLRIDANPTGVDDPLIPQPVQSLSSYPNPFREQTTISFGLKGAAGVKVDIYNLKGQHVRKLLDESKSAGEYQVQWDARDEQGIKVSDGIYLYKIQAGKYSSSKKMILLK